MLKKPFLFLLATLMCLSLATALTGCTKEGDTVGNIIDKTMWNLGGYPSQQEIRDHLEAKYGEPFDIQLLNSGSRFFQGAAFPVSDPSLVFNLEMHDNDGNPLPIDQVRDDFQARLAERMIAQRAEPILVKWFGDYEIAEFRVEVSIFDSSDDVDWHLAPSFDWLPSNGLEALAAQQDISIDVTLHLTIEDKEVLNMMTQSDYQLMAEEIVEQGDVPLSANLVITAADGGESAPIDVVWTVADGEVTAVTVSQ
ncbi:MAG: hypothetical protein FWE46_00560 [Coriobacteriia bacterium]|nr:hypothetical protein [Coriobacteriia bacterium]MCL2536734.1 hypothetical protein [Coriobacteriia bacterium]